MTVLYALLLAVAVLLLYCLPTILCAHLLRGKDTSTVATITLGIWGAKMLILIIVFVLLGRYSFFDRTTFAVTLALAAVVVTAFEIRYLVRRR
jgi:hypothetical protein